MSKRDVLLKDITDGLDCSYVGAKDCFKILMPVYLRLKVVPLNLCARTEKPKTKPPNICARLPHRDNFLIYTL